ncbi:MAG TPA: hypothetical protein VE616_02110, partial [Candidatus Udaeobacter sp.]|nr:hypothetical protein [Candidatus Udaeobacter sp.]
TPPHGDAVTFGYGAVAYSGMDFHHADVAPSRAHSFPRARESRYFLSISWIPGRASYRQLARNDLG